MVANNSAPVAQDQHVVVSAPSIEALSAQVLALQAQGWQQLGGVAVHTRGIFPKYCQTMFLPATEVTAHVPAREHAAPRS